AGELPGQFRREAQAGAVIDHHAGEPPQQWDGLGAGGEEPVQRLLDDPPEAIDGAGVQTLSEALLAHVEFITQFVDGCRGVFEPAEDQSLHEAGPGNLPSALNHPRFFGGGVGLGGKQGLENLGQFVDGDGHEELLSPGLHQPSAFYQRSSSLSRLLWGATPRATRPIGNEGLNRVLRDSYLENVKVPVASAVVTPLAFTETVPV